MDDGATTVAQLAALRQLCATGAARYVREASGSSLRDIADEMSRIVGERVSPSTPLRYETGRVRPIGPRALAYLTVIRDLMASTRATPAGRSVAS